MTETDIITSGNEMLTAKQAAKRLGVPVSTFYRFGIVCYKYGPRTTRWAVADVEEHRQKCRSLGIVLKSSIDIASAEKLAVEELSVLSCFKKVGVEIKPNPTGAKKILPFRRKPRASTRKPR